MTFGAPEGKPVHVQLVAPVVLLILKSGDELYLEISHLASADCSSPECTLFFTCSQLFKLFGFPIF